MTMEELDMLRGYGIATLILAFIVIGIASNFIPDSARKAKGYVVGFAGLLGGMGGLVVFFLFNFIVGWEEYFAAKATGELVEYYGRHQATFRIIKTLGEMDVSSLGVVSGIVGVFLLASAFVSFKSLGKT